MAIDNKTSDETNSDIIKSGLASAFEDGIHSTGQQPERTEVISPVISIRSNDTSSPLYPVPTETSPTINDKKIQTIANMQILSEEIDELKAVMKARSFEDALDFAFMERFLANLDPADIDGWLKPAQDKMDRAKEKYQKVWNQLYLFTTQLHYPGFINAKGQLVKRADEAFSQLDHTPPTGPVAIYTTPPDGTEYFSIISRPLERPMCSTTTIDPQYLKNFFTATPEYSSVPTQDSLSPPSDVIGYIHTETGIPKTVLNKMSMAALMTQCLHIAEFELRYGISFRLYQKLINVDAFDSGLLERYDTNPVGSDLLDDSHARIFKINSDSYGTPQGIVPLEKLFRLSLSTSTPATDPIVQMAEKGGPITVPHVCGWSGFTNYLDPTIEDQTGTSNPRHPYNRLYKSYKINQVPERDKILYLSSILAKENLLSDGLHVLGSTIDLDSSNLIGIPDEIIETIKSPIDSTSPVGWRKNYPDSHLANDVDFWSVLMGQTHKEHIDKTPLFHEDALGGDKSSGFTSLLEQQFRVNPEDPDTNFERVYTLDTGSYEMDAEDGVNRLGTLKKPIVSVIEEYIKTRPESAFEALTSQEEFIYNLDRKFSTLEKVTTDLLNSSRGDSLTGNTMPRYHARKIVGKVMESVGNMIYAASKVNDNDAAYKSLADRDAYHTKHKGKYESGTSFLSLVFVAHYLNPTQKGTDSYKKLKKLLLKRLCENYFIEYGVETAAVNVWLSPDIYGDDYTTDDNNKILRYVSNDARALPGAGDGRRQLSDDFKADIIKHLYPNTYRFPGLDVNKSSGGQYQLRDTNNTLLGDLIANTDNEGIDNQSRLFGYGTDVNSVTGGAGSDNHTGITGLSIDRSAIGNNIFANNDSIYDYQSRLKYKTYEIMAIDSNHQLSTEAKPALTLKVEAGSNYPGVCFEARGFELGSVAFRCSANHDPSELGTEGNSIFTVPPSNDLFSPHNATINGTTLIDEVISLSTILDPLMDGATNDATNKDATGAVDALSAMAMASDSAGTSQAHGMDKADQLALLLDIYIDVINLFVSSNVVAGLANSRNKGFDTPLEFYMQKNVNEGTADNFNYALASSNFSNVDVWQGAFDNNLGYWLQQVYQGSIDDPDNDYYSLEGSWAATNGWNIAEEFYRIRFGMSGNEEDEAGLPGGEYANYPGVSAEVTFQANDETVTNDSIIEETLNVLLENFHCLVPKVENKGRDIYLAEALDAGYDAKINLRELGDIVQAIGQTFQYDNLNTQTLSGFKNTIEFYCTHFSSTVGGTSTTLQNKLDKLGGPGVGALGKTGAGSNFTIADIYNLYKDCMKENASTPQILNPVSSVFRMYISQNINFLNIGKHQMDEALTTFDNEFPEIGKKILVNSTMRQTSLANERLKNFNQAASEYGVLSNLGIPALHCNPYLDAAANRLLEEMDDGKDQNILFFGLPRGMAEKRLFNLISQDSSYYIGNTTSQLELTFDRDSEFSSFIKFEANPTEFPAKIYDLGYITNRDLITEGLMTLDNPETATFDQMIDVIRFSRYDYETGFGAYNTSGTGFFIIGKPGSEILAEATGESVVGITNKLKLAVESELLKYLFERTTGLSPHEAYLSPHTSQLIEENDLRGTLAALGRSASYLIFADDDGVGLEGGPQDTELKAQLEHMGENIDRIIENLFDYDESEAALAAGSGQIIDEGEPARRYLKMTTDPEKLKKVFEPQLERISALETAWKEPVLSEETFTILMSVLNSVYVNQDFSLMALTPGTFDYVLACRVSDITKPENYDVTVAGEGVLAELGVTPGSPDSLDPSYFDDKFTDPDTPQLVREVVKEALTGKLTIDNFRPIIRIVPNKRAGT